MRHLLSPVLLLLAAFPALAQPAPTAVLSERDRAKVVDELLETV